jgi:tetratricopeptide (TPR) repeat protein
MVRIRFAVVLTAIVFALIFTSSAQNLTYAGENTATTPDVLRRVPPPSADMSVSQLEARADQLRALKSYPDAIDYYKAAIKRSPTAILYNKMGIAELQMIHNDEAKKCFEKAAKLDPNYAEARNNLGVIAYVKKNFKKAIKNYQQAIDIDSTSASFYSNLGTAHFARKEFDRAMTAYARALELDPEVFERTSASGVSIRYSSTDDRARYSYVIAKMFAARGETEKCLLYLRRAIEDGYPVEKNVYNENEFAMVRKDKRFQQLMEQKPATLPN